MATELIDYSFARPNLAQVKAAGVTGVIRYLTGSGKGLTTGEIQRIRAAGLSLTLVYETTGRTAKGGRSAGVADGQAALSALRTLGLPRSVVYFAVDYDLQPGEYGLLDAYLDGIASVLGKQCTGVYAGYGPCAHAMSRGYAAWQTYAWSGGKIAPGIRVYQYRNGVAIGGGQVDRDRTSLADYGQVKWNGTAPAPAPAPAASNQLAVDGAGGPATVRRWQQVMGTTIDGIISGQSHPYGSYGWPNLYTVQYGSGGSNLIRAVQRQLGLAQDGSLGPITIRAIQAHLGVAQDASFGPATVRALQQRLNTGRF
jgi:hypothetical protein